MATTAIAVCAGLIAAVLAVWVLPPFLESPSQGQKPDVLVRSAFLLPVPYGILGFWQRNHMDWTEMVFAGTALWFLYVLSVTDLRQKIVPNRLLLWMGGIFLGLTGISLLGGAEAALKRLILAGIGSAMMGLVFLIAYFLSRRQLGGGDVKLVTLMGLYLTATRIVGAVFYGLLLCAVFSIVQMARKKLDRKDGVPLVPFLFIGTFLCCLLRL